MTTASDAKQHAIEGHTVFGNLSKSIMDEIEAGVKAATKNNRVALPDGTSFA